MNIPNWGLIGWIQFCLNCVIILVGFYLAGVIGSTLATSDPHTALQFFGIGLALIGLGWSLLASQFSAFNIAEIKKLLKSSKNP